MASSPLAPVQTGQCSEARDRVPAIAPEGAKTSKRPRSLS
jgi:hypothetical protein